MPTPTGRARPRRQAHLTCFTATALVVVAGTCVVGVTPSGASPTTSTASLATRAPVTVGATPLGVNTAAWDALYTGSQSAQINDMLEIAGVHLLRYPGGSWADEYQWSTNTDSSKCTGAVEPSCTAPDPLDFGDFSLQAREADASSFVTVNYGSGTASDAAKWVAHARSSPFTTVDLWEVGNESYSCYETNLELAEPPTSVNGYIPGGQFCPTTATMTNSYTIHAKPFFKAMKKADPSAKIGVPWAFSDSEAKGAAVSNAGTWNTGVLHAFGPQISFVDAHWYPIDKVAGLSNQQILDTVRTIAPAAAHLRATLKADAPKAAFVVGETNISERLTTLDFQPIAALFAAATTLEWLTQGASSVVWWDLNNYGSPATGDYGLVSSSPSEPQPSGSPYPSYYGEMLASLLTTPGSKLQTVSGLAGGMLGFESDLSGQRHVLLVNPGPAVQNVTLSNWFASGGTVGASIYDSGTAVTSAPIATTSITGSQPVPIPPLSVVVLSGTPG